MTVFLVELEPVETRYTSFMETTFVQANGIAGLNVEVIAGPERCSSDTTGAFLNFSGTNY